MKITAILAGERFLAGVEQKVTSQVGALAEGFRTLGTNVRSFICVRSLVFMQHFFGLERLVAQLAREWALLRVHHLHVV